MTGIYTIGSNSKPDRIYVGSAVNMHARLASHLSKLRRNKHHSQKLQNHVNKYGVEDLYFTIVETCKREELLIREQYYIDTLKPWFNICPKAGNTLGATWSLSDEAKNNISEGHKGLKHSEESKRKRSEKLKGRKPSELACKRSSEVHKGKKLSEEHIAKLRKANKGNQRAKGRHWKLSDETKAKMRAAAIKNNNAARLKKKTGNSKVE